MTLSQPVKAAAGALLLLVSAAITFGPFLPEEHRTLVGYAFLIAGLLISDRSQRHSDASNPPKLIWAERDVGQKLSIVMFHVLIVAFVASISWAMATRINAWYGPVLGALALTAAAWLSFRNWQNRNAR